MAPMARGSANRCSHHHPAAAGSPFQAEPGSSSKRRLSAAPSGPKPGWEVDAARAQGRMGSLVIWFRWTETAWSVGVFHLAVAVTYHDARRGLGRLDVD